MFNRKILIIAPLLLALYGCEREPPPQYAHRVADWKLADKTGCFQCHTTGKNLLGPAWESVSERYRNNPDAEAHLMNKIRNGGNGAWISRTMPGYSEELLSTENRKKIVRFILSLK